MLWEREDYTVWIQHNRTKLIFFLCWSQATLKRSLIGCLTFALIYGVQSETLVNKYCVCSHLSSWHSLLFTIASYLQYLISSLRLAKIFKNVFWTVFIPLYCKTPVFFSHFQMWGRIFKCFLFSVWLLLCYICLLVLSASCKWWT